jgi:hypothetical protein
MLLSHNGPIICKGKIGLQYQGDIPNRRPVMTTRAGKNHGIPKYNKSGLEKDVFSRRGGRKACWTGQILWKAAPKTSAVNK